MRCVKGCFIEFVVSLLLASFSHAVIPEFVSVRPGWEAVYKSNTVDRYSDSELRTHFEDLRSGGEVPAHIHDALDMIIRLPVGRSTIADIVASVEPRLYYARSLREIVEYVDDRKDDISTAEEALRTEFGVVSSINPLILANAQTFNTYITSNLAWEWYSKLNNSPEKINQSMYLGDLFTTDYVGAANFLYEELDKAVRLIEEEVASYLFQFSEGDDSYATNSRVIAVRDMNTRASVVSGPRLSTMGSIVGIVARDTEFLVDERLFHEILHYSHMTLRKEYILDDFTFLGKALISNGFDPAYTGILKSLWTDQEEFRTITGLFINPQTGVLSYSVQNESRYLHEKSKSFRCGHSLSYCTKVPLYFVRAVSEDNRVAVHYALGEDREVGYVKQHNDLV